MKKLLVCIAIAAICAPAVKGQTDSSSSVAMPQDNTSGTVYRNTDGKTGIFSISVNPSLPIGHFKTFSGFGLGGYLGWESKLSRNFGLTLNAGYIDYFGKTADTITYSDFGYIPVLGGAKIYMSGGLYLHGEAGAGFGTTSGLGTSFWYGGGLGYSMTKGLDLELKYVGWKQHLVNTTGSSIYGGGGNPGGGSGGGGGYGGHYSTIDLRLGYRF